MNDGLLDVRLSGRESVVAAFLVDTPDGPGLIDCGAASTLTALKEALAARGVAITDLRHLLLTHIHLDHAGAAGHLVRENPDLQVHGSELGVLYLAFPEVLEASARGVYGAAYDELWGALVPVPEKNVHPVGDKVAGLDCVPTPGHASHHVAYLHTDGTMYAGDAAGVRIGSGTHVTPPTTPPDVDVALWLASLDAMAARNPSRLALTHFGVFDDPTAHLEQMRRELTRWYELVRGGIDEAEFVRIIDAEVAEHGEQADYHLTVPKEMLYQGLRGYIAKNG